MTENKQYSIVWEINSLEGESPLDVAKKVQDMLQSNDWQYYVQDEKTKELFSVDLQEEDDDAVIQVTGEYIPIIAPKLNLNKTYYLLGDDAVHIYCKDGLQSLITAFEDEGVNFDLFCFVEGETKSVDLLYQAKKLV